MFLFCVVVLWFYLFCSVTAHSCVYAIFGSQPPTLPQFAPHTKKKHVGTNSFSNLCFWVDFVILSSLFILGALGCWQIISKYMYKHIWTQTNQTHANTHTHAYIHTHRLSASTCVWWRDSLDLWYSLLLFTSRTSLSFSHTHESRRHATHVKESCHAHKGVIAHTWRIHATRDLDLSIYLYIELGERERVRERVKERQRERACAR